MQPPTTAETTAFRSFELAAWGDGGVAQTYDEWWGSLTQQAVPHLLDAAAIGAGSSVLDVATGPGFVAAAAAERGATVTGIDFSAAMVARARAHYPTVRFAEGDAETLAFPEGSFDAVTIAFGLLHLARPDAALAEAHRVLQPGGRVAFTVWAAPPATQGFAAVLDAIAKHGRTDVPLPPGPPFFRFADPDECRRTLVGLGYDNIATATVAMTWRSASVDMLCTAFEQGTARTRGLLRAQTPKALEQIRAAIRQVVTDHMVDGVCELAMTCVLTSATKA